MFSERRVVVVLNANRLRAPRHQRTQEVLARGLAQLPDYSTLIFVANAEDGDSRRVRAPFDESLMAALKAVGQVKQFSPLKPEELAQLVVKEGAAAGKRIPPTVAAMIAQRAGPDTLTVLQETRKLIAYALDRETVTPQDVEALVPAPPDESVFHLLDAAMVGDRKKAMDLLQGFRASGVPVWEVTRHLGRTVRQVTQAKFLAESGVRHDATPEAIPAPLLEALPAEGRPHELLHGWQRQRLWEQARRFSWDSLHQALDQLAVMDAGAKGWEYGVEDPALALELYVSGLCDLARPQPPGRRS